MGFPFKLKKNMLEDSPCSHYAPCANPWLNSPAST